jgi:hypothetical protein
MKDGQVCYICPFFIPDYAIGFVVSDLIARKSGYLEVEA